MARYFAIIGAMRTGSNLLERTLAQLGDTACHGEAFNPAFVGGPRKTVILGWTKADRDADPFGFLRHLIQGVPGKIAGFRIFDGHHPGILDHVLTDPDCARIVLTRNPLEVYVSLTIARATDQWMINDPAKRVAVKVRFDPDAFAAHKARLAAHYDDVSARMAAAGASALWIDYADLAEPATFARVARHIGSTGSVPARPPIHRQNPGALADKVINHREMCAALGLVPGRPHIQAAGLAEVLLSRHAPLALAPIAGPALAPAVALIQRLEARGFGAPQAPRSALLSDPAESGLFERGVKAAEVAASLGQRAYMAPVSHPFARVHHLFVQELFGSGWRASWIRRRIEAEAGALPDPKALEQGAVLPPERHRAAFAAFLDLCFAPVADVQPARPDWAAQAELLDAFAVEGLAPSAVRHEDLGPFARQLAARLGIAPIPPGQLQSVLSIAGPAPLDLAAIADPALEAPVRDAHAGDYARFGYAPWAPGAR